MIIRTGVLLLVWLCASGAAAAQRVEDYAYGSQLDADGSQALYEVTLPPEVYENTARADLGDVRVFNGAGEVVPYAWKPRKTMQPETAPSLALTLFPLKAAAGSTVEGLAITVRRNASGAASISVNSSPAHGATAQRTVGYLIDLNAVDRALRALVLEWAPSASGFAGRMNVDASDDLATWRNVVTGAPLLALEAGGRRLEQKRIELPLRKARYLRLSWVAHDSNQAPPELSAARGELAEMNVDVPLHWKQFEVSGNGKPGEYMFDVRAHYPVDRVRLRLPETNTIVQVEVSVREKPEQTWRSIGRSVFYRLHQSGQEITSPDLNVGAVTERYWLISVDQRGGGIGSGALGLSVGWVPHRLVFNARGSSPFRLVYGNRDAVPSAYSIEALIPGYKEGQDSPAPITKAEVKPVVSVSSAGAFAQQEIGGEARRREAVDWKRWSLWGVLVLGVVILGFMAWRLSRQLKASQNPTSSGDAGPQA